MMAKEVKKYPKANIDALFLAENAGDFYTSPVPAMSFDIDGIIGDQEHRSRSRIADSRIKPYRKGIDTVLNRQSVSLIDNVSLVEIADRLQLDPDVIAKNYDEHRETFLARCMGANILLNGFHGTSEIPTFYELPNATDFGPYSDDERKFTDATVMITRYNGPCINPGNKLVEHYPLESKGLAAAFVSVAMGIRGYVGMVVKSGKMVEGQEVTFIPLATRQDFPPVKE